MHEASPGRDKGRRRTARSKLPHIREIRGDMVLLMYAKCMTQVEIADELGIDQATVSRLLATALEDRAKQDPEIRARARALMIERLNLMLSRWFPLAIGSNPNSMGPDRDAADMALKIMDRLGKFEGLEAPASTGPAAFVLLPDTMRADILASLDETARRVREIEAGTVDAELVDDAAP